MERKLIVTLLQKNIQELEMITKGFMEMTEYPPVIVELARRKTEDILDYVRLLEEIKSEKKSTEPIVAPIVIEETVEVFEEKADDLAQKEAEKLAEEKAKLEAELAEKEAERLAKEAEMARKMAEEKAKLEAELAEKEAERLAKEAEMARKMAEEKAKLEAELAEKEAERLAKEAEMARKLAEERARLETELAEKEAEKTEEKIVEKINKQPIKTVLGEQIAMQKGENDTTIGDAHTQKKIDDIRHAISIGDRFRFQRELFGGNGELMSKTLSKLNGMIDFDEAKAYLQKNFKWESGNETVESFYSIVKRKFL